MRNVYLYDYFTVIESNSLNVDFHSHIAHQLSLSLSEKPLIYEIGDKRYEEKYVFLPSMTKHRFLAEDCHNLTILIDDEASIKLESMNLNTDTIKLNNLDRDSLHELLLDLGLLSGKQLDERIKKAIVIIAQTQYLETIKLRDVAHDLDLSESRFIHLFKDEMGITFRKYIQWQKMKRAASLWENSKSLTQMAIDAGFSDSSHFSKFFKQTFGLGPKEVFKNSRFIQESKT